MSTRSNSSWAQKGSGSTDADDRLRQWWQANDLDDESQLPHLDALIAGHETGGLAQSAVAHSSV